MAEIRYIHAADLHLDAPFAGLSRETGGAKLGALLHEATFTALERLVRICEAARPHFLVLAGDIYNQEDASIRAQLKLRDACARLADIGVMVFMAHGNHDPIQSRINSIRWPENVVVFGADSPQTHALRKDGETLALVHGISHNGARDARNLAKMFSRDKDSDCFQLGVLHCAVDNVPLQDRYAPCSIQDLTSTGLDAWALGHVHERSILCQQPLIAYSGNIQGLHINECGPRGCLAVTATPAPGGWVCAPEFHALGPLQWEKRAVNLEQANDLAAIEERLNSVINSMLDETGPETQAIIARLCLQGRTNMDGWLRQNKNIENLNELLAPFSGASTPVFIKDFEINTINGETTEDCLAREDLVGETMRICKSMLEDDALFKNMKDEACAPLYAKSGRARLLPPMDDDRLRKILSRAERLCQDILEGR